MRTPTLGLLLAAVALPCLPSPAMARTCHATAQAASFSGKDTCIAAHVYAIAQLRDGTRFLDVCSPETSDTACTFTVAVLPEDTRDVGDLKPLIGTDIELRGIVHSLGDPSQPASERSLIYLSNARQLHGGSEKFHPNPALLAGYSAETAKSPVHDPSLSGNHHFSLFRASR